MASKALLFLSLIVVLLIASEVVARDLAEKSAEYKNNEGDEVKQTEQFGGFPGGGYGGFPGGGYGNRGGGYGNRGGGYGNRGGGYGNRGGGYGNRGGGYGNRGGGYCRYGCCYRGYYGGCSRCCSYAGQAVQTQQQNTEPGH